MHRNRTIIKLLFLCYLVLIFRITVFRSGFGTHPLFSGNINCSLFTGYHAIIANRNWGSFIYLFFGNIIWFVPFGFVLSRWFCRSPAQTLLLGFLLSLTIEVLQFVFGTGISELDDLILNSTGTVLGWLLGGQPFRKGCCGFVRLASRHKGK